MGNSTKGKARGKWREGGGKLMGMTQNTIPKIKPWRAPSAKSLNSTGLTNHHILRYSVIEKCHPCKKA